jgi:hypothetical protein
MLCATRVLHKHGEHDDSYKPLPCKRWSCPECGEARKRQLRRDAIAGAPTAMLTLTVNPAQYSNATERRTALISAWKILTKRILRQFALKPQHRWQLGSHERHKRSEWIVRKITDKTQQAEYRRLHYFAFVELTKAGEPHLHILLRAPYIPHDWISEQMQDLLAAPVVWIEAIKQASSAASYVAKYLTKAPATLSGGKRYFKSRWYVPRRVTPEKARPLPGEILTVERMSWSEFIQERTRAHFSWHVDDNGWHRFFAPGEVYLPDGRLAVGMLPAEARGPPHSPMP